MGLDGFYRAPIKRKDKLPRWAINIWLLTEPRKVTNTGLTYGTLCTSPAGLNPKGA